ncbi:MAG TPA: glycosyltransferase family 39 protein [Candidatus Levybacteria bacterium]|nr:glycosyltransferase family 39 protein [Candidatus Levybacteria bacterium]
MKAYFSRHWILCIAPLIFLLLKLSTTSIRLSDTNVYFYTAYQILQGKLLYADIFFTNFPIFPYLSAIYLALSDENIYLYYFSSSIEIALTSVFIYAIIYYQWKSRLYAITGQCIYLFSFIILATSDHQSGVFAASLFAVISYFFFQRKKFFFTGCFLALAILTKAYFLPLTATYGIYFLLRERRSLLKFVGGAGVTALIILSPFILFAREGLISNVFEYSLTRGAGTSKGQVFQFFMFRDSLFFFLLLTNLLLWKKHLFFALFSLFSLVFILLYQDIYYLYLNNMIPFLVLSFPIYQHFITTKMNLQKMVIPSFVIIILVFNFFTYFSQYKTLQTVTNFETLIQKINSAQPEYLYGANDLTTLLAYTTNTPMLNNLVDTNGNIFRKGILDAKKLTQQAIAHKTILVVHGASYPQYEVEDPILDEVVVKDEILKHCHMIYSHPVYAEGVTNRVNLFQCFD